MYAYVIQLDVDTLLSVKTKRARSEAAPTGSAGLVELSTYDVAESENVRWRFEKDVRRNQRSERRSKYLFAASRQMSIRASQ